MISVQSRCPCPDHSLTIQALDVKVVLSSRAWGYAKVKFEGLRDVRLKEIVGLKIGRVQGAIRLAFGALRNRA